jgi:prepilin-type N-terminal cleavage/methylation domain-containing protein
MRSKGFTLLELLVVIAILALLIAILIPVISILKQIAWRIICAHNLKQIGIGLIAFADDHDSYPPYLDTSDVNESGYLRNTPEELLRSYLPNPKIWYCPADRNKARRVWYGPHWYEPRPDLPEEFRNISYVWSESVLRGFYPGYPKNPTGQWQRYPYHYFKGGILADGDRMLNMWDWREALWIGNDPFDSLDQSHGNLEYHKVNMLFADTTVEHTTCDKKTVDLLLPW